jgi:hypothetical protein
LLACHIWMNAVLMQLFHSLPARSSERDRPWRNASKLEPFSIAGDQHVDTLTSKIEMEKRGKRKKKKTQIFFLRGLLR